MRNSWNISVEWASHFIEKASRWLAAKVNPHLEDETHLPFFFDVVVYSSIESAELKRQIDQKGKRVYRKNMCEWKKIPIYEYIGINPTTFLPKGAIAKKVSMENNAQLREW